MSSIACRSIRTTASCATSSTRRPAYTLDSPAGPSPPHPDVGHRLPARGPEAELAVALARGQFVRVPAPGRRPGEQRQDALAPIAQAVVDQHGRGWPQVGHDDRGRLAGPDVARRDDDVKGRPGREPAAEPVGLRPAQLGQRDDRVVGVPQPGVLPAVPVGLGQQEVGQALPCRTATSSAGQPPRGRSACTGPSFLALAGRASGVEQVGQQVGAPVEQGDVADRLAADPRVIGRGTEIWSEVGL